MSQHIHLEALCQDRYGLPLADCSSVQIYEILVRAIGEMSEAHLSKVKAQSAQAQRRLYYLCAEFLLGRLLVDRMIHLGVYDQVREQLRAAGKSPDLIEQQEKEPSLGNGGLGRLAACFLDSIAALGLPGDGMGLLYHFGLFRQRFEHLQQNEVPDTWLDQAIFLKKQPITTVRTMGATALSAKIRESILKPSLC
jgi:starch phosphorylase